MEQKIFESKFEAELKNCNTMKEVLVTVEKYYNLDEPLGFATKILVVGGVKKIIKLIQAARRIF